MTVEKQEGTQEQSPEELFEAMSSAISSNDSEAIRKLADEDAEPESLDTPTAEEEVEEEKPEEGNEEAPTEEEGSQGAAKTKKVAATAAKEPDYKAEFERAKNEIHRLKSDAGRVPFLQKRLAELERAGRTATSQAQNVPSVGVNPDSALGQRIAKYKEIDPELADLLLDVVKDTTAHAQVLTSQTVEQIRAAEEEAENQRFYHEQIAILAEKVPQYKEIFAMPQWAEWKDKLTPGQRAMAESGYANDVTQAIYAFGNYMKAINPQQQQQPQATTHTEEAKKVQAQRAARQESSPSSKSTPAKKEKEFDENAYFNEQFNKVLKENHLM